MGNCLVAFLNIKFISTTYPAISLLDIYLLREMETMSTQRFIHNIHCSFIHNTPKVETTQIPWTGEWVNKVYIYPYNKILLSEKKEWIIETGNDLYEFQKHCAERKTQTEMVRIIWFINIKCELVCRDKADQCLPLNWREQRTGLRRGTRYLSGWPKCAVSWSL